jgi:hypothetical protein
MNLIIEKLGLENAKALDGILQKHAVPEDWKISVINGMWQRSSVGFTHAELRAAIADHDRTDYVSDIRNHIAPTTKVIEG